MKFKLGLLLPLIPLLFATHCATIFSDRVYDYEFESEPAGATVKITSRGNLIASITTPASIPLDLRKHYDVHFELSGYKSHRLMIDKDVDLWILANVLNLGYGLPIDAISGAIHKPSTSLIRWEFERAEGTPQDSNGEEDQGAINVTLEFSGNHGRKVVAGFQMKRGTGEVVHRLSDLNPTVY
ncbi:MAG: hypothetical protein NXI24_03865 [bacterium]|nr:hypothetical protein [bacterium]